MRQDPRTSASVVFLALLSGQLAFVIVAMMIERSVSPPEGLPADLLLFVSIVVAFGAIVASRLFSRTLLKAAVETTDESERMSSGLRAFIVRMAILEAGGLLAIVAYLLTGEITFLGIFAVVFAAFVLGRPSESEWDTLQKGNPQQAG